MNNESLSLPEMSSLVEAIKLVLYSESLTKSHSLSLLLFTSETSSFFAIILSYELHAATTCPEAELLWAIDLSASIILISINIS